MEILDDNDTIIKDVSDPLLLLATIEYVVIKSIEAIRNANSKRKDRPLPNLAGIRTFDNKYITSTSANGTRSLRIAISNKC